MHVLDFLYSSAPPGSLHVHTLSRVCSICWNTPTSVGCIQFCLCPHKSTANLEAFYWYKKIDLLQSVCYEIQIIQLAKAFRSSFFYITPFNYFILLQNLHIYIHPSWHRACKCSGECSSLPFASYSSQQCINGMQRIKPVCEIQKKLCTIL